MSECIEWTGKTIRNGYGYFWARGKTRLAHRVALEEKLGRELGRKELACHKCDNPLCVNPDHLFVGSHKDNWQDMIDKGRGTYA